MTSPDQVAAALTYFRSIGFRHGDQATCHADTLLAWTDAMTGQARRDREAAADANQRIERLRGQVRAAIDDPANASLADVVDAIAALLEVKPREGAAT